MPRSIELSELERRKMAEAGRQSIACTNGWRPIETAPKDIDVLLWNGDGVHIGKYITEYGKFYARDMLAPKSYPTHWQPLPKPPVCE